MDSFAVSERYDTQVFTQFWYIDPVTNAAIGLFFFFDRISDGSRAPLFLNVRALS